MTQEAHHADHIDPAEANMTATELIEHRLNRVNLALTQLQAVNHNAMSMNLNAMTMMQKDVVFCLHVMEKLKEYLPKDELEALANQAVATAPLPAYAAKPSPEGAPVTGGMPLHEQHMPLELRAQRAPVPEQRPVAMTPMKEAAVAAQSALNHLGDVARQVQAEQQAGVLKEPRSVAAARNRPTRESSLPPTAQTQPGQQEDAAHYLGHFIGTGSLFSKYFSPENISGGKGFVTPGYGGFHQYKEDALQVAPVLLHENAWASGFYRDTTTRLQQFLLMSSKMQVLVVNLPNPNVEVYVSFSPFAERVNIRTLSVQQLQLVYNMIDASFMAGERLAAQG